MTIERLTQQVLWIMDMQEKYEELDHLAKEEVMAYLDGMNQRLMRLEVLSEQIRIVCGWITKHNHG